jgi:hypothetical protein
VTWQLASTTGTELFDTLEVAEHRPSSTAATICPFFWANTVSGEWFDTRGVARRAEYRQRAEQMAKRSNGSGQMGMSMAEWPAEPSIISEAHGAL